MENEKISQQISIGSITNYSKNKKGITLIALVITIIVLLILAGVTINLTLGENGIFKTSEKAAQNYTQAQNEELIALEEFTNEAENIINGLGGNNGTTNPALGTIIKTENNINYTADGAGNIIPVPIGFSPITTSDQGNKNTGFVIKNDTDENEYVWVPVDDATRYTYDRYAFSREDWSGTQSKGEYDTTTNSYKIIRADQAIYYYAEEMSSIEDRTELQSVTEYGGFYIGRYEVGIVGYTSVSTKPDGSTSWTGYSNGTAVIQKGKQVWNYITRDKAKEIAENMYSDNDAVISRLCSSYAWDTALKFIETQNSTYPTNSVGGYYEQSVPTTTEYDTTHPCNIYDMGGNVWEWTTEVCGDINAPYTIRGGSYWHSASNNPAAARIYARVDLCPRRRRFSIHFILVALQL